MRYCFLVLVVYTATLFLKWASTQFQAKHIAAFQHDGHQLQWLSRQAHSGLMNTVSQETAWCEQRGGIFMSLIKGLESLEMQWVVLSSHNGNNYQTKEAHFWNKVWFTIQLTLGCSHQIPSVSTAERLSAQLGPVPMQYLMLLPLSAPAHLLTLRQILMQARWNVCYAESCFWIEIELPQSPYRRFITVRLPRVSWFIALSLLHVWACVCTGKVNISRDRHPY